MFSIYFRVDFKDAIFIQRSLYFYSTTLIDIWDSQPLDTLLVSPVSDMFLPFVTVCLLNLKSVLVCNLPQLMCPHVSIYIGPKWYIQ